MTAPADRGRTVTHVDGLALVVDLAAVLLFVGIGRHVHAHGLTLAGLASTAWPFASGLVAGWVALLLWGRGGSSLAGGSVVWVATVAIGMVLRVVSGQGTAVAFVLVALAFLGATMLGGRIALGGFRRPAPSPRGDGTESSRQSSPEGGRGGPMPSEPDPTGAPWPRR